MLVKLGNSWVDASEVIAVYETSYIKNFSEKGAFKSEQHILVCLKENIKIEESKTEENTADNFAKIVNDALTHQDYGTSEDS